MENQPSTNQDTQDIISWQRAASVIDLDALRIDIEEDANVGHCTECGAQQDCVEPDAERYCCDECGAEAVFGTINLLLYLGSFL